MADAFSDQFHGSGVPEAAPAGGRALVPLTLSAAPAATVTSMSRPDARFVAHLIATATHAPQTRNLRQAPVKDVVTRYADASARDRAPRAANGIVLSMVA
jgi:hypothetical protein